MASGAAASSRSIALAISLLGGGRQGRVKSGSDQPVTTASPSTCRLAGYHRLWLVMAQAAGSNWLCGVMPASDRDLVKVNLLIEGLMGAISLGTVHTAFMYDNHSPKRPLHEAQALTLDMIWELVSEGLFVLGRAPSPGRVRCLGSSARHGAGQDRELR
jgi:hypothetical protein